MIGQSATIECLIEGEPSPTLTWYFNGAALSSGEGYSISTSGMSFSLRIMDLEVRDEGVYTCTAVNFLGNDSASASLNVLSKLFKWSLGPV